MMMLSEGNWEEKSHYELLKVAAYITEITPIKVSLSSEEKPNNHNTNITIWTEDELYRR